MIQLFKESLNSDATIAEMNVLLRQCVRCLISFDNYQMVRDAVQNRDLTMLKSILEMFPEHYTAMISAKDKAGCSAITIAMNEKDYSVMALILDATPQPTLTEIRTL